MKKIIILVLGIAFLTVWVFVDLSVENQTLINGTFLTLVFISLFTLLFFALIQTVRKFQSKLVQIVFSIPLFALSIIYCLLGYIALFEIGMPNWEDTHIYTNNDGTKVIYQFREISGSIYDFRERLVLYEFTEDIRLSKSWSKDSMTGTWEVYNLNENSVFYKSFDD